MTPVNHMGAIAYLDSSFGEERAVMNVADTQVWGVHFIYFFLHFWQPAARNVYHDW